MIVLLSIDTALTKQIKKIENVEMATGILDCYAILDEPDMECDILILDAMLVDGNFFDWIIEKNLFIKKIIIYFRTNDYARFASSVSKLHKAHYSTYLIPTEQLVKAMETL